MLFKRWVHFKKIFSIFCLILIMLLFFQIIPITNSSDEAFVDLKITRPFENQVVKAGGPAYFVIDVNEFKSSNNSPLINGKQDVKFYYEIYNQDGKIIYDDMETLAVVEGKNSSSFKKEFYIPMDSKEGFYALNVFLESLDGKDLGNDKIQFKVVRVTDIGINIILIVLAIGFIIAILAFLYEHKKVRKLKVSNKDFEKYL